MLRLRSIVSLFAPVGSCLLGMGRGARAAADGAVFYGGMLLWLVCTAIPVELLWSAASR